MAVTTVNELPEDGANEVREQGVLTIEYRRSFDVYTDDINDSAETILDADDLPKRGEKHPDKAGARVYSRNVARDREIRTKWRADISYRLGGDDSPYEYDDPLEQPAEVSFASRFYERSASQGYHILSTDTYPPVAPDYTFPWTVEAITNSAGIRPEEVPVIDRCTTVMTVRTNVRWFNALTFARYHGSINSRPITVCDVFIDTWHGRFLDSRARSLFDEDGEMYWEVQFDIEIDQVSHNLKFLANVGTIERSGSGWVNITGVDEQPITEPVALDPDGYAYLPGTPPYFMMWLIYEPRDWGVLNLPRTIFRNT